MVKVIQAKAVETALANPHELDDDALVEAVRGTKMWKSPDIRKKVRVEAKKGSVTITFKLNEDDEEYGKITLKDVQNVFYDAIEELNSRKIILMFREASIFRNGTVVLDYAYHP